ncbi:MAG: 2-keto-myo-inositol isomerase [Gaiellales bacterium]|nr:2-keto-myo-inositol isomerase [Gaiellales bacterium]
MRLAINTSCMLPSSIESEIPAIAAAGFEWVELRTPEVRDYLRAHSLADLRRLLDDCGVRVGSINALEFVSFRGASYAGVRDECRELCEWSAALGCDCVIAVPSPTPSHETTWDEISSESARVLTDLASITVPLGITLGFEPLGFGWCSVRTVAGACEILSQVGSPHVGLVLDLFHFALGGSRVEELELIDIESMPIVHVDDFVRGTTEATTDAARIFPGEGDLAIGAICGRLVERGFDGLFSLELFRPEYWEWEPARVAERGYATLAAAARSATA